jgi:hypothetical protein
MVSSRWPLNPLQNRTRLLVGAECCGHRVDLRFTRTSTTSWSDVCLPGAIPRAQEKLFKKARAALRLWVNRLSPIPIS